MLLKSEFLNKEIRMKIKFTKMQGLGNDFVVLDYEEYKKSGLELNELALKLCDRHFGIGADGLMVVNPFVKDTDAGWLFYNSDGTTAQMCGNGIRCFARYMKQKGYMTKNEFSVETLAGTIIPKINEDNTVTVNMNKPITEPVKIPLKSENNLNFEVLAKGKKFVANAISMGNPHCVIFTDEDTVKAALEYGPEIEVNPLFPEKTNVEFIKILSRSEINLNVWERGCGITLACGTGACASVVAGILNGYLDEKVKVNLPGGQLVIEWKGNKDDLNRNVYMTGPATFVFEGEIEV